MPRITIHPSGTTLDLPAGAPLQDHLFAHGVEFPCGGKGRCRGCRVRVVTGQVPVTEDDRRVFAPHELDAGWRLSCRCKAEADLGLELAQWTAAILSDDRAMEMPAREGTGIAIDLGSTTLVAQAIDRATGAVLGVRTALNPQAQHGADLMTRVDFARNGGADRLRDLIRAELGRMVAEVAAMASAPVKRITIVGNTVMHHLFGGIDILPLAFHPFEPTADGLQTFRGSDLGWNAVAGAEVLFLPCLGGFVGSDILAGILATGLHRRGKPAALVDLGTNGEIVVGSAKGMLCASTAAGPAFEGASISCGMRAATGAVAGVEIRDGALRATVLGGGTARGVCGSGLVDAVAAGLELGWVRGNGRLADPARGLPLTEAVKLVQKDVRELQLAKGAIAAGIGILAAQQKLAVDELERIHLAGAFGNYINRTSAHRIGLLPFPAERVAPSGNTALLGARLALNADDPGFPEIRALCRHYALKSDPGFEDAYVDQMAFPA